MFLEFSDAAYLPGAKNLLKHKGSYEKTMSKSFCLQENIPPLFRKYSGNEKFYGQKRGYDDFSVEFIFLTHTENFRRGTILFQKKYRVEKLYRKEVERGRDGESRFSVKSFCLNVAKIFVRNPPVPQELVSRIFMHKRRYHVFPSIFFVLQCRHNS